MFFGLNYGGQGLTGALRPCWGAWYFKKSGHTERLPLSHALFHLLSLKLSLSIRLHRLRQPQEQRCWAKPPHKTHTLAYTEHTLSLSKEYKQTQAFPQPSSHKPPTVILARQPSNIPHVLFFFFKHSDTMCVQHHFLA